MRIRGLGWLAPGGRGRLASVACAGMIAVGAVGNVVVERVTALPDEAVMRVGDITVSEDDFRQRVDVLGALYGAEQPSDEAGRNAFRRDAAQAVATSIIIDKVAGEQGIGVSDDDGRAALDKIVKGKFPGGREQFNQALGNLRVNEQEVLTEIKRQLNTERVFDNVTKDAPAVNEGELRRAYDERKQQLGEPEKRELKNIVVDTADKAADVAGKAKSGRDFGKLAAESSLDKSTASKGGNLGMVAASQLEPEVAKAAFGAADGGIFGPVQGGHGWNVGQVVRIQPPTVPSFEQAADGLRRLLVGERKIGIWKPWLAEQLREAQVEYADDYRPANPDALPPGVAQ